MGNWSPEKINQMFKEFLKEVDPDSPKERKRKRIIDIATSLFLELGYRKTSIDKIARQAGVAKGTVYIYFKSKNELLMHAIGHEKKRFYKDIVKILQLIYK